MLTVWQVANVFGYLPFNGTLVIVKANETENPYLMRLISFRKICQLVRFANGDVFVGIRQEKQAMLSAD